MNPLSPPSLRVYVLESLHRQPDLPLARQLFTELISLRIEAYRTSSSPDYVPLDASDFVGRHHLICAAEDGPPRVLAGISQVLHSTAKRFGVDFPLSRFARAATAEHLRVAQHTIELHQARGVPLYYGGRFCMRTHVHEDRALARVIRELLIAFLVDDLLELPGCRTISIGLVGKTSVLFEGLGYRRMASEHGPLPTVEDPTSPDPLALYELEDPSAFARDCHARARAWLDGRIWVSPPEPAALVPTLPHG